MTAALTAVAFVNPPVAGAGFLAMVVIYVLPVPAVVMRLYRRFPPGHATTPERKQIAAQELRTGFRNECP